MISYYDSIPENLQNDLHELPNIVHNDRFLIKKKSSEVKFKISYFQQLCIFILFEIEICISIEFKITLTIKYNKLIINLCNSTI